MRTEKTELSVMKYHDFTKVSLSVCPDCPTPCFVIVRGERDLSTTILVAKFTCIEKLEKVNVDFQRTSKNNVTDNPIWRQTTVRNARARQVGIKNSNSLKAEESQ